MLLLLACTNAPLPSADAPLDTDDSSGVDEGCEESPYWADLDGDGYGDPGSPTQACSEPEGYAPNDLDCDDGDAFVSPDGLEECNGRDDDCDGEADPPDAYGAQDWWPDEDGDGYGDQDAGERSCAPEGAVFEGGDCDDLDAEVHPQATETLDGRDEDCDGVVDDGLPWGHGGDGDLLVTGDVDLSDHGASCSRVARVDGLELELDDVTGFASGDRVLLLHQQGTPSNYAEVGTFELLEVAQRVDRTLVLLEAPQHSYGDDGDVHAHVVSALRVPQFASVEVQGELSAPAWDGACGGVLALLAADGLELSGVIDLSGAGYRGGEENSTADTSGEAGESLRGPGPKSNKANGGGGGGGGQVSEACEDCEGGGGGGGHLEDGEDGASATVSKGQGGQGGVRVTTEANSRLLLGAGGGAGARDQSGELGNGGAGGAGGGMVLIWTSTADIEGVIRAHGEDGEDAPGTDSEAGAGGGGAGGTIAIWSQALDLQGELDVGGGQGGASEDGGQGGDGGAGRVVLSEI